MIVLPIPAPHMDLLIGGWRIEDIHPGSSTKWPPPIDLNYDPQAHMPAVLITPRENV